jgi:hypothetical protein
MGDFLMGTKSKKDVSGISLDTLETTDPKNGRQSYKKFDKSLYHDIIAAIELPKDVLEKINENVNYNKKIEKYYRIMAKETNQKNLFVKAKGIKECNTVIEVDRYKKMKIKDYKSTNLCRDKFCSNCKKLKQAARMAKYIPILKKRKEILYHAVFTQPNCGAKIHIDENGVVKESLDKIVRKMAKKFKRLIQYLRGEKKIRGLDFSAWGYVGAIRSLEITIKPNPNDPNCYHVHYHVILALDNHETKLDEKYIENTYSHSIKSGKRLFSDEEILIQKIWRLLMTDTPVTKKAIDELEIGYSCIIEKCRDSDYLEMFKYMTKSSDEDGKGIKYEHFKTLYNALYNIKQIQGYGIFYNISDDVTEEEINQAHEMYDELIEYLKKIEEPVQEINTLDELLTDTKYTLISRKRILKNLIKILRE